MEKIFALILFIAGGAEAPAKEDIRARAYQDVYGPYKACVHHLRSARYDAALEECRADKNRRQERCEHDAQMAATTMTIGDPDPDAACDALKPTHQHFLERLEQLRNDA